MINGIIGRKVGMTQIFAADGTVTPVTVIKAGPCVVAAFPDRWAAGENAVWRARAGAAVAETGPLPDPFALELAGEHARAAAAWRRLDSPYDAAWALAGSDDESDLRAALDLFDALGAGPAAALVAQRLRQRGVRGPRPSTRAHPAGLTAREQEVLELLAEGLRNAEIADRLVVSEKTVGHHVSSILGKLGVRSRYDAARIAREDREAAAPT